VHGFLHLIGYDHEGDKDAAAMERTEREILRQLAIPDPYRPNTRKAKRPAGKRTIGRARATKTAKLAARRPA
jgi:hypothetical protein